MGMKKLTVPEKAGWIIELAKDQAKADQDPEWENKVKRMSQTVRE